MPGIDGAPTLGDEELPVLPLDCELLRELLCELLREEELLDEEELLLDGIELLLVGIWAEGGWLLLEVVLQPPARDASTTGINSGRMFTVNTCTSK